MIVRKKSSGHVVSGIYENDLRELIDAMKRAIGSGFNYQRAGLSAAAWDRIKKVLPPICPTCGRPKGDKS